MENEIRRHTIGIYTPECSGLAFAEFEHSEYERQEKQRDQHCAYKAFFFAYGAENKVGMLLGHIFELGLRSVEEALAEKSAGTNMVKIGGIFIG